MSVAACLTSRNESDIAECSIRHMLAEGIDLILIADASDPEEGTRDILNELARKSDYRVRWFPDANTTHYQPALTMRLVEKARSLGANWVLCSDMDEFFYSPAGVTIAEALANCPYGAVHAERWIHHDWDHRYRDAERLPKVAFRPGPGVQVTNGNHGVNRPGVYGVLQVREIPYRSYEHFRAKVADRIRTFDRRYLAEGGGYHILKLEGAGEEALRAEWEALKAIPSVYDPIPSRSKARPKPWSLTSPS